MGKTILIVDDEPDILELLSARLEKNNFQVFVAKDGKEGLNKLLNKKADLIVLDIVMPVLDGFSMLKSIKQNPELLDIPVIIITGRSMMKDTFYAMGVDYFFSKPYDTNDLLEKINFLLSKKTLLLSSEPLATDKISNALRQSGYIVKHVESSDSMFAEGRRIKYNMLVAHISCIKQEADEFAGSLWTMKNKNMNVILYSDASVNGLEDGDIVKINDVKQVWYRAGLKLFYDSRTEALPLASVIQQAVD
jgi:DNA-binding response OmpR family regulator